MKHIQCVFDDLPDLCPNRGSCPNRSSIVDTFIWFSFHLKIRIPLRSRTLIHSLNPDFRSLSQVLLSFPYFLAIQLSLPKFFRCGGSNTTNLKVLSGKGIFVKSSSTSGFISNFRPSQSVCDSVLISPKTTFGFSLSNQNILLPQQGSRISLFILKIERIKKASPRQGQPKQTHYEKRVTIQLFPVR